ncbi:MAG: hypothetical protein HC817_16015, partial [Saprospiraceae bacterium]|nr:hypothetical protein [Saprospiraceae bacterium]
VRRATDTEGGIAVGLRSFSFLSAFSSKRNSFFSAFCLLPNCERSVWLTT